MPWVEGLALSLISRMPVVGRFFLSPTIQVNLGKTVYGRLKNYTYGLVVTLKIVNRTQVPVLVKSLTLTHKGKPLMPQANPRPSGHLSILKESTGWLIVGDREDHFEPPFRIEPMGITDRYALFSMPPPAECDSRLEFIGKLKFNRRAHAKFHFAVEP